MKVRALVAIALACVACGEPPPAELDGGADDAVVSEDAGAISDAPEELRAEAGESRYALVGEEVVLDGSASTGATSYEWFPSGGLPVVTGAIARVRYDVSGRYQAVLTVRDASGRRRTDTVVISVTHPPVHAPRQSSTIAVTGDHQVAVVSPDSDELAILRWDDEGALAVERRVAVCDEPRTLSPWRGRVAVACQAGAEVALVDAEDGAIERVVMPHASAPFGVAGSDAGSLWVTLQATGEVGEIVIDGGAARLARTLPAIVDARAIAVLPDGRVGVTRWRSPDARGELAAIDPASGAIDTWALAFDPQVASDTEVGGVPSYLEQLLVSPDARVAVVPSLQAAIGEGLHVTAGARALTFETTIRAVLSFVDPITGIEDFEARRQLDNRGFANAGVFSSRGDWLFVATRGTRTVERIDVLARQLSGSIQGVGFAPSGVALSPDDRFLFVDAYLSREVLAYDVTSFASEPTPIGRATIPTTEPLSEELLLGKRLFNDSWDPRLSSDGYVACAHCHLDGLDDHRVWDFTDRGEGLRNTATLRGVTTTGAIHWSANFDEVQDFEHDLRGPFRGRGLMRDEDYAIGTRNTTLGDRKAGVSADLDALAAYVESLATFAPSPFRAADGTLPEAAARGRAHFESAATGCTGCHAGERTTDSGFDAAGVPRLHDVGTLGPGSGSRLGGTLPGIDTPTLHGVWSTPPYLHDGSAPTLRDVLTTRNPDDRHGTTSHLTAAELDDLVVYLFCLDGRRD